MLSQEKKQSSRLVRLSIAGILLIVVVLAVGFSFKSTASVGEKNMIVGVESDNAPETMNFEEGNLDTQDDVDMDLDGEEDDEVDAMDMGEDDILAAVYDKEEMDAKEDGCLPKKVKLCQKICGKYFKNPIKKLLCKKDCKKYNGDSTSPKKCPKDCKKACKKLLPKGNKRNNCKISCILSFCPRPVKYCLNMCVKIGLKHFKKPKGKYIFLCKKACRKNKKFRARPKKCKKKCKKACKKFAKKGKKKFCKKDCNKLCPIV